MTKFSNQCKDLYQIAQTADAKVSYLTSDHLGSPRITTDANGQVVSRRDFQPFGEEIARAGYGTDAVRQKFTSYFLLQDEMMLLSKLNLFLLILFRKPSTSLILILELI